MSVSHLLLIFDEVLISSSKLILSILQVEHLLFIPYSVDMQT